MSDGEAVSTDEASLAHPGLTSCCAAPVPNRTLSSTGPWPGGWDPWFTAHLEIAKLYQPKRQEASLCHSIQSLNAFIPTGSQQLQ